MFEKSFFCVDSNSIGLLNDANYHYGYKLRRDGYVVLNSEIPEFNNDSDFVFGLGVTQEKNENSVYYSTDKYGMGIIFYYHGDDGYFAISNSFYKIFNFLKDRRTLTVNKNYCSLFNSVNSITTLSFRETLVNEIKVLPQNCSIKIDRGSFEIQNKGPVRLMDFDSQEGLNYIDDWANKWMDILQVLVEKNKKINIQLSGGFDSRVVLALVIASGIDLSNVNIESSLGMKEDLQIASDMADFYGFSLNQKMDVWEKNRINEIAAFELNKLCRLGLHKEFLPAPLIKRHAESMFQFSGWGNIRGWYNGDANKYLKHMLLKNLNCHENNDVNIKLSNALKGIVDDVSSVLRNVSKNSDNFLNFVYNFTRSRWNYGTTLPAACSMNQVILPPLLDLIELNPINDKNKDYDLIFSYIYNRFAPDLLSFKFSGGRSINPGTVVRSKGINSKSFIRKKWIGKKELGMKEMLNIHLQGNEIPSNLMEYISREYLNESIENLRKKEKRHNEVDAFGILSLSLISDINR